MKKIIYVTLTSGDCTIKLFLAVIAAISKYARVFANSIHFHPSLISVGKSGVYSNGRLLVLTTNIRLGWK